MLKYISSASCALILGMLLTTGANAATVITSQNFDTVTTGSSGDGVWYVDRFAPSGFTSELFAGDNRLALDISASDGAQATPSQNTQGRKYNITGADTVSIDMYIDSTFGTTTDGTRYGGIWGTSANFIDGILNYPIIEFFDQEFNIWDPNSGWLSIGLPADFLYDTFVNLKMSLDVANNEFNYFVGGELLATLQASGQKYLKNVILQGINGDPGVSRTLYFDNLLASVVPVPPALPLFGAGIAVMGFLGWRRKRKIAA